MRQRQEGVTEFKGFFQVFHYSSISEGHQSPRWKSVRSAEAIHHNTNLCCSVYWNWKWRPLLKQKGEKKTEKGTVMRKTQHLRKTEWTGRQKGICYTTQAAEQAAELWPNDGARQKSAMHVSCFALFHESQSSCCATEVRKSLTQFIVLDVMTININDVKLEFFVPGPSVCPVDFTMARNLCWSLTSTWQL